jgi:glutamyl-tRNA synthetase
LSLNKVRVRFAPSPTGPLHIGGLRTAIFNFLFARKNNGDFILRIEDTDQKREVLGAEKYIIESLNWCGIKVDEMPGVEDKRGPYRQSERNDVYKKHILSLIKKGKAYYAFDSSEELEWHRNEHKKRGKTFIYNWHNRLKLKNSLSMSSAEVDSLLNSKAKFVVRFKAPSKGFVKTSDIIRGNSEIDCRLLEDKVLVKADGTPTYHFANVVDDYEMGITHVVRGEEWLPSLALHYLIYDAFNWGKPLFAHLPLILNPNGKGKLSKRTGENAGFSVFPLKWENNGLRESGILPEALFNYLATLGSSSGNTGKTMSLEQLVEAFELNSVVSAAANFDFEKLKWYNHKHIQEKNSEMLLNDVLELMPNLAGLDQLKLIKAIDLVKERATTLIDLWALAEYLFFSPKQYNEKVRKKVSLEVVNKLIALCEELESRNENKTNLLGLIKNWSDENNIPLGKLLISIRIIVVGEPSGIDLDKILSFIGFDEFVLRLNRFVKSAF